MTFTSELIPATLIRRYKRFLADMHLENGDEVVAHCANPGAMTGLQEPGARVWLEPNSDPKKKLKYGWRLIELVGCHFACVDTSVANRVVKTALMAGAIPELAHDHFRAEVPYGEKSRVDFLLTDQEGQRTYVEVKSVTLCRKPGLAEFPDSVTARGSRHLKELANVAGRGDHAVMLYLVQRTDCTQVCVASDIDPAYGQAMHEAQARGVKILAFDCMISPEIGVQFGHQLPFLNVRD